MKIDKKEIVRKLKTDFKAKLQGSGYIVYTKKYKDLMFVFKFRVLFQNMITFEGFSIYFKQTGDVFSEIFDNYSQKYSQRDMKVLLIHLDFYKTDFNFVNQEIKSDKELDVYLNEVRKCIDYYEETYFKTIDFKFLVDYFSLPFKDRGEAQITTHFPLFLFRRMAVLKWGNKEELYLEYKEKTFELIEEYAIVKPEDYDISFKTDFNYIVDYLENKPNPFEALV